MSIDKFDEIKELFNKFVIASYECETTNVCEEYSEYDDLEIINFIFLYNSKTILNATLNINKFSVFYVMDKSKLTDYYWQVLMLDKSGWSLSHEKVKEVLGFCHVNCETYYLSLDELKEVFHNELKATIEKILLETLSRAVKVTRRIKL